mmetsp:Transcript_5973/g.8426  ORF Transcript_5973/g.8426 Transcript_5973/m.8426 type:complete len:258 (-) Transcript_5973:204-977(-)
MVDVYVEHVQIASGNGPALRRALGHCGQNVCISAGPKPIVDHSLRQENGSARTNPTSDQILKIIRPARKPFRHCILVFRYPRSNCECPQLNPPLKSRALDLQNVCASIGAVNRDICPSTGSEKVFRLNGPSRRTRIDPIFCNHCRFTGDISGAISDRYDRIVLPAHVKHPKPRPLAEFHYEGVISAAIGQVIITGRQRLMHIIFRYERDGVGSSGAHELENEVVGGICVVNTRPTFRGLVEWIVFHDEQAHSPSASR